MGIWQVKRLGQRRARNAVVAARWALPPLALGTGSVAADSARQRRVTARGVYDFSAEKTWPGRSFQGTPGVALITPLRLGLIPPRGRGDVDTKGYLSFVIQLETPDPERGLPRRWPVPVLDDGPHLSYTIQWFSFAIIVLVGTAALLRSRK